MWFDFLPLVEMIGFILVYLANIHDSICLKWYTFTIHLYGKTGLFVLLSLVFRYPTSSFSLSPAVHPSIHPSSIEPSVYRSAFAQIFCISWNPKYISLIYRHFTLVGVMKVSNTQTWLHLEYNRYGQNRRKQIHDPEVLVIKNNIFCFPLPYFPLSTSALFFA